MKKVIFGLQLVFLLGNTLQEAETNITSTLTATRTIPVSIPTKTVATAKKVQIPPRKCVTLTRKFSCVRTIIEK